MQIYPGVNTIYVEAEDTEGLITRERFVVYGEDAAAADASED